MVDMVTAAGASPIADTPNSDGEPYAKLACSDRSCERPETADSPDGGRLRDTAAADDAAAAPGAGTAGAGTPAASLPAASISQEETACWSIL